MSECVFCDQASFEIIAETGLSFAIRDKYPVRPLHTLIVSKRHVEHAFELTEQEFYDIFQLSKAVQDSIKIEDRTVGGFNFGSNVGACTRTFISYREEMATRHLHLQHTRGRPRALS